MAHLEVWKELIQILYPKDHGLSDEVTLALENADEYFDEYKQELGDRGIDSAAGVTGWLALIDGLISRKQLVEVDWKAVGVEVVAALAGLSSCRERKVDLTVLSKSKELPEILFPKLAELLRGYELSLCSPDISSDSWPLIVVEQASVPRIVELARFLGEKITVLSPPE